MGFESALDVIGGSNTFGMVIALVIRTLHLFVSVFDFVLFIYIILGWFSIAVPTIPNSPFYRMLEAMLEPMLAPFRVVIRIGMMGLDLAPIFALIIIHLAEEIIVKLLIKLYYII